VDVVNEDITNKEILAIDVQLADFTHAILREKTSCILSQK